MDISPPLSLPRCTLLLQVYYRYQVADKGRAIRYNISSAMPLHDEGMMTGAFLSCTLDPNLLLE